MLKSLIKAGNFWYIRKLTFFGYEYLDKSGLYWWVSNYGLIYCRFNSEEEARAALPVKKKL